MDAVPVVREVAIKGARVHVAMRVRALALSSVGGSGCDSHEHGYVQ